MIYTRLTWLLGILGLMPGSSNADDIDTYPLVNSGKVESESYELRRLLCKNCGQVVDVVYLPDRESFFASTRSGDLWQINNQGYIVDVLRDFGLLSDSGIHFGPESYVDWMFTGDKAPKPYREIINADRLSQAEFDAQLEAAEAVTMQYAERPDRANFYLREGDSWRMLEREHERGQLNMRPPKGVVYNYPNPEENKDKNLPLIRLSRPSSGMNYDWQNTQNPLYLQRYDRQGRVRRPFMDINGMGWSGTYGRGEFHLIHQAELLKFNALHRVSTSGTRRDAPDIDHYLLSQAHTANAISFLGLYGRRQHLAEEEQGFYVVRPRADQASGQQPVSALHQHYNWQPVFEGFSKQSGVLRQIIFINGQDESPGTELQHTIGSKLRPVPLLWDFYHQLPEFEDHKGIYIKLNQTFYGIRDSYRQGRNKIYTRLQFNEEETVAAFLQLQASENSKEPIALKLSAEWLTEGLVYQVVLQQGVEQITLKQASIIRGAEWSDIPESYILDRLDQAFNKAFENESYDRDFMGMASRLASIKPQDPDIAEALAGATVKLMISRLENQNADVAEKLFDHYIEQVLPHAGFHPKAFDIASNALVLGIVHQRPMVIDRAFDHLLGGKDIDIKVMDNDALVYNLACYYAVQQQKTKMLEAISRAIELGKKPEQFLTDNDFASYWTDKEFLAKINP